MSASLYDVALVNKLQNWIKDENLKITSPNETRRLFEYKADQTNDQPIKLPLITLRKDPTMTLLATNKKAMTFDGWRRQNNGNRGDQLNAVPIQLNYQIDIYTRYEEEAEEYIRNFVFNIINYPKLEIEIPYNNSNIKHISNIRLMPDISNNSDIPERLIPGQFTRFTLTINIDDAFLWNYRTKDNAKIDIDSDVEIKLSTDIDVKLKEEQGD